MQSPSMDQQPESKPGWPAMGSRLEPILGLGTGSSSLSWDPGAQLDDFAAGQMGQCHAEPCLSTCPAPVTLAKLRPAFGTMSRQSAAPSGKRHRLPIKAFFKDLHGPCQVGKVPAKTQPSPSRAPSPGPVLADLYDGRGGPAELGEHRCRS